MSFTSDLEKFARKIDKNTGDLARATLFQMNKLVVERTPVDTGRARGAWVATIDRPSMVSPIRIDTGSSTISSANRTAGNAIGKIYYLANNVKYIGVLEFGGFPNPPASGDKTSGGFSKLAPRGMVRVTVKEIQRFFDRKARELRGR